MKKIVCCLLCFIAISWSCTRDMEELAVQHDAPLTVPMAKEWFETRGFPWQNSKASSLRSESAYPDLIPLFDWDLAELNEDSAWTVVELPWEYENGHVSIATPEVKDYVESHDRTETPQLTRLVVMKSKTTGDTYGFKMVVIPGMDYMLGAGGNLETNKYLSRDAGLSGLVMFYSLAGEFVNGWQYAGGQITGRIEEADETFPPPSGTTKSATTRSSWEYVTIETCYYVVASTDGGLTWSEPRLQGCKSQTYSVLVANLGDQGPGGRCCLFL